MLWYLEKLYVILHLLLQEWHYLGKTDAQRCSILRRIVYMHLYNRYTNTDQTTNPWISDIHMLNTKGISNIWMFLQC